MKHLIYFVAALMLTGCRTSKSIEEHTEEHTRSSFETDSLRIAAEVHATVEEILELTKTETEELTVLITNFSTPDSAGVQHPISTASIKRSCKSDVKQQEHNTTDEAAQATANATQKSKQEEHENERDREQKEKPPERWPYIVLVAIVVAAGWGIYTKLKK